MNNQNDLMQNSSHARAPAGNWGGTLVIFVLGFVVLFMGLEFFWRSEGHVSNINDSQNLWAQQRDLIRQNTGNPKTIVLIGASRIQLGIDTQWFRKQYPDRPLVNLAIDGATASAVLRDLAMDKNFNGLLIASMKASGFGHDEWDLSQPYVDRYHKDYKPSLDRKFNTILSAWLQQNFISLQHNLSLRSLLKAVIKGDLPEPFYIRTYPDRARAADYTMLPDIEEHRAKRLERMKIAATSKPPQTVDSWKKDLKTVHGWVEKIQSRGGKVVFVRFPTSGMHWDMDDMLYPRAQYWDHIYALTGAQTIHFQDVSGMSDFNLPDTSHLDQKDRQTFTALLMDKIKPLLR